MNLGLIPCNCPELALARLFALMHHVHAHSNQSLLTGLNAGESCHKMFKRQVDNANMFRFLAEIEYFLKKVKSESDDPSVEEVEEPNTRSAES